jgi:hypothetical protein
MWSQQSQCYRLNMKCPTGSCVRVALGCQQWDFGKWLDPGDSDLINGLISWWICIMLLLSGGGSLVGGSRALRVYLWRRYLVRCPFFPGPFASCPAWNELICSTSCSLPWCSASLCVGPEAVEPRDHGLKPLKLSWNKSILLLNGFFQVFGTVRDGEEGNWLTEPVILIEI